jgi:hypothetical protein
MERKIYQPTEKQEAKWAAYTTPQMPSDEEFKARWAKSHGGKTAGWGMAKRDWVLASLKSSRDYQVGIWQGRVDAARGLDYSEERNDNHYNLGYHRGYCDYTSDRKGWDAAQRAEFDAKYLAD